MRVIVSGFEKTIRKLAPDYHIVVVTHYAPLLGPLTEPRFRNNLKSLGYASDCSDLMEDVDIWIYGHTHFNADLWVGNCHVISNQLGYPKENTGYHLLKQIIETKGKGTLDKTKRRRKP